MSMNMSQPPAPPMPPPGAPPVGNSPFSEEEIQQIALETGYSVEQVKADIARTGATSKEQLYPAVYSGSGIQPQGETVSPGAVQGEPPTAPGAGVPQMPPGAAPAMAMPAEAAGEPAQSAPPMQPEGIDPELAQKMHSMMAPKFKRK